MSDPWVVGERDALSGEPVRWNLIAGERCVASVWKNSNHMATWHTWDDRGFGGENDVEECDPRQLIPVDVCRRARADALLSAITQGFAELKSRD